MMLLPEGAQSCVRPSSLSKLFNQVPVVHVPTNKRRVIQLVASRLNSKEISSDENVIMSGPTVLSDETDVKMAIT